MEKQRVVELNRMLKSNSDSFVYGHDKGTKTSK